MSDQDIAQEIQNLRDKIQKLSAQINACKADQPVLENKINRLKKTQKKIQDKKQEAGTQKYRIDVNLALAKSWKGSRYNNYKTKVDSNLTPEYTRFYRQIDDAISEIEKEIARLEKIYQDQKGTMTLLNDQTQSLKWELNGLLNI